MNIKLFQILLLLFSLLSAPVCQSSINVVDSSGKMLSLDQPARKIISLAPNITELLFAIGAGKFVVGAAEFSDFPPKARLITRVGGFQTFDFEKIITLKPDLVIAWQSGTPLTNIEKLKKLGIPVFVTEAHKLEDIPVLLNKLARLTDTRTQAQKTISIYNQHLTRLRQQSNNKKQVSVFYQIWQQPLMTINAKHMINQIINACGGVNVFADMTLLSGTVGIEDVLLNNPDVIIINDNGDRFRSWASKWKKWKQLKAVQANNIFSVTPDIISRHSPRILSGADEVCAILDKVR